MLNFIRILMAGSAAMVLSPLGFIWVSEKVDDYSLKHVLLEWTLGAMIYALPIGLVGVVVGSFLTIMYQDNK